MNTDSLSGTQSQTVMFFPRCCGPDLRCLRPCLQALHLPDKSQESPPGSYNMLALRHRSERRACLTSSSTIGAPPLEGGGLGYGPSCSPQSLKNGQQHDQEHIEARPKTMASECCYSGGGSVKRFSERKWMFVRRDVHC